MNNFKQLLFIGLSVFFIDQISKFAATFFGMSIFYNAGISLSFLSQSSPIILTFLLCILVLVLFVYFKKVWKVNQVAAGLFFGGAGANIFDRIIFGSVRDWILIPTTQIHNNIADLAIFFGLALLFFSFISEKKLTGKVK